MSILDPQQDPTSPTAATVQGIVQPAQPLAVTGMSPPAPVVAPTGMGPQLDFSNAENDSVSERVAAITAKDAPIMQQARTSGQKLANARGLLNSTMGIQAAEDSAYRAATPIASQEAAQAASRNAQRLGLFTELERMRVGAGYDKEARFENFGYQTQLQQDQFDARMNELQVQQAGELERLQKQIASAEGMQKTALEEQMKQLQQNHSNELVRMDAAFEFNKAMAAVQNGYAVNMAKLQKGLQSQLQAQANTEQLGRMEADFQNQTKLNEQQNAALLTQIKAQGDQQLTMQANEFEQRLTELTAQLNNQNSQAAATAAVNLFNAEAQLRASIMSNPNIPAAERAALLKSLDGMTAPVQSFVNSVLGEGGSSTTPDAGTGTGMTPPTSGTGTGTGMSPPATTAPASSGGSTSLLNFGAARPQLQ